MGSSDVEESRPSKSKIRRAGSTIRRIGTDANPGDDAIVEALETCQRYRSCFADPTRKVLDIVNQLCIENDITSENTSRLKRLRTIVEKLAVREDGLDLSRMRDLGGCRAVVVDLAAVRKLESFVCAYPEFGSVKPIDYIEEPRVSGYRSLHLIIDMDGLPVELQIRTLRMHDWAQLVENWSMTTEFNLKQDSMSTDQEDERIVREFLATWSEHMAHQEHRREVPEELGAMMRKQAVKVEDVIERQIELRTRRANE